MTQYGWYYEGGNVQDTLATLDDALTAAIEDAVSDDDQWQVFVGPMYTVDPASLVDAEDILEIAKDRIADRIEGGTAILAFGRSDALAAELEDWLRRAIEPDPAVSCAGTLALPIHYVEGEWTHGVAHEDGDIAAQVWFSVSDGWSWCALGEKGSAVSCGDAMMNAEAVIARNL